MKRRKQLIMMALVVVVLCGVGFSHAAEEKAEEVKAIKNTVGDGTAT